MKYPPPARRLRVMLIWPLPLLVAAPVHAAAPAPASEPDTVVLSFRWPDTLQAQVESQGERARGTDKSDVSYRYRFNVSPVQDQLRVHGDQFAVLTVDGVPVGNELSPAHLVILSSLMPDYRVTKTGEFVGVHDLPGMQKRMRDMFSSLLPPDAPRELPAEATQLIETLLSEAVLNQMVEEQWNVMVGTWQDAELELGETYETQIEQPVAVLGNATLRMNIEVQALRWLPCQRGGMQRQCVEVSMHSSVHPEDARRAVQSFLRPVAGEQVAEGMEDARLTITNRIDLVTEPNGLIPHQYSTYELVTIEGVEEADDTESSTTQVKKESARFTYR